MDSIAIKSGCSNYKSCVSSNMLVLKQNSGTPITFIGISDSVAGPDRELQVATDNIYEYKTIQPKTVKWIAVKHFKYGLYWCLTTPQPVSAGNCGRI